MKVEVIRLVFVWLALLALLALTVFMAFLPLGTFRIPVAYAIGTAKAALVLWFFMEMRREGGIVRLAAGAGFVWISVLLILSAADVLTRG
jgi:cytochrome c oxidase subunit 4